MADDATDSTSPIEDIGKRENMESCGLYLYRCAWAAVVLAEGSAFILF